MSLKSLLTRTSAVVALAAMLLNPAAHAAKAPQAQVGVVSLSGSPTSGSDVSYQFDLSTTNAGTLLVKASYKSNSKALKGKLADLTTTPTLGNSVVVGPSLHVPSSFTGTITFKIQVFFNGKKIANKPLIATITTPPPVVAAVTENLYDVGFENSVTLNGNVVPTSGMASPRTYSWIQTSGKTVVISDPSATAPTFTTDAATNFVYMGTGLYVNDPDDFGHTNQLYVTPEHRFGSVKGLALDAEQAGAATYAFRVLVSDGSITRTGIFNVACSSQTPAHPNIPVGVTALYKGATNSTSWTLLAKPAGSTAVLNHPNGLIAEMRPDMEGVYVVQDNVSGKTITNTAASWTGTQFCAICHGPGNNVNQKDLVTPWSQTAHASFFQRAVDGAESSHYGENCIACHVVGLNKSPAAVNGGFDDVATQLGWKFPSVLKPGNFAAMPAELKDKSNISCESCHGPGSRHPGSPSVTLETRVCASCHQDGSHHVRPQQWEMSPHGGAFESISNSRGTNPQCARCHSPVGFVEVAKGNANVGTTNSVPIGAGPATCQTCHDPHDTFGNPERHQLRVYDSVLLGNPYFRSNTVTIALGESLTTDNLNLTNSNLVVTNTGASAACIVCHNGRQLPTQVQLYGSNAGKMFYQTGGPHDQTAGEVFLGVGAYDYGQNMGNSFHTHLSDCQSCHMYQLRAPLNGVPQDSLLIDDVETPVTTPIYNQFANTIGNHTFEMDYQYVDSTGTTHVVENTAACNQCHASFERVESFDFKSVFSQDYDGNGQVEGVQTETRGMLNNLGFLLKATGVTISTNAQGQVTSVSTSTGYSSTNTVKEAQRKAAWNWLTEYREGSFGVHNTQYTIRLLQTTYTDLSTNFTGNAVDTYKNAFPNAYLR